MVASTRASRMPAGIALGVDAAFVLVFAAVGRAGHDRGSLPLAGEGNVLAGVLGTAWPFLVGLAVGWLAVRLRSHRWPLEVGPGISVVVGTVAVGMLLRALTGQGTAWSFVVVATLVLAVLLLGWRLLAARIG